MTKWKSLPDHYRHVWDIFHFNWLYLVNLDFLIGLQLLIFGGGLLLAYFGSVPAILLLLAGLVCVSFFNLSLTGVSKNYLALARERGPGKYPTFSSDYLWLGLPVLIADLLVGVLPALVSVAVGLLFVTGELAAYPYALIVAWLGCLGWQWRFGLAPAVVLDRRVSLRAALEESWRLTGTRQAATLGLLASNLAITLVGSLVPVIGTVAGLNWGVLSSWHLYWQLRQE